MNKVKMDDICDFFNGGAWSDKEYVVSGLPVLKVSNCKNSGFQIEDINYLPITSKEKYSKNKLYKGDVIIATVGSHPNLVESAAGRSCVVNSLVDGFYLNQNAVCLRTKDSDILDQGYLGYLCKERRFQHFIQNKGRGAANQMRISIGGIKEYEFDLPDIDIQRKIASILTAYDALIENNQKQIKLLEEAAQRLYKEWFVDLRFPGHDEVEIVDGVPVGWDKTTMDKICDSVGGGTPSTKVEDYYRDGNIKWVTPTDITRNDGLILLDTEKKITQEGLKNSSAKMVPPNTILMTSRASVGYFGICEYEVCTNQGFISCIPNQENYRWYLLYNLLNRVDEIRQKASGSTFLEISKRAFRELIILKPNDKVLDAFDTEIISLLQQMKVLKKQIVLLQNCRDSLLPKLMSGKIEV